MQNGATGLHGQLVKNHAIMEPICDNDFVLKHFMGEIPHVMENLYNTSHATHMRALVSLNCHVNNWKVLWKKLKILDTTLSSPRVLRI